MDYTNILAVKLDLPIDNDKITSEILSCQEYWKYTPAKISQLERGLSGDWFLSSDIADYRTVDYGIPNYKLQQLDIVERELRGPSMFYLTEHVDANTINDRYDQTKTYKLDGWSWQKQLTDRIPYTKSVIESYFEKVGCVRVFVMPNTFLVTHQDYNFEATADEVSADYDRCLGLSLIPSDGGVPMKIWSRKLQHVVDVPGNAMIFNDSVRHGVPKTTGYRITIRIFGKVNYEQFTKFIDPLHCYTI